MGTDELRCVCLLLTIFASNVISKGASRKTAAKVVSEIPIVSEENDLAWVVKQLTYILKKIDPSGDSLLDDQSSGVQLPPVVIRQMIGFPGMIGEPPPVLSVNQKQLQEKKERKKARVSEGKIKLTEEEVNQQCTIDAKKYCDAKVEGLTLEHNKFGSYYFNMDENAKLSWYSASDFCIKHGMQLVVMETKEENDMLISRVEDELSGDNAGFWNFFWTSLNDMETEGRWVFGGVGDEPNYTRWNFEEPNNYEDDEHCGSLCKFNGLGWNDLNCSIPGRFICELSEPCKSFLQM